MKVMDVYAREFIHYCDNYHFFFFDQDDRREVCNRLGIDNKKLDEIIEYAIDSKFCSFFDPYLPTYVAPTNHGLRALGLESGVSP